MPTLSRIAIRLSLIHFLLAITAGAVLLFTKALHLSPTAWRLLPLHQELALAGWVLQLIYGVAYWILPRFSTPPYRGNPLPVALALVFLNLGVLLVAGVWLLHWSAFWLPAGRVLEAGSALAFASHAWPRIKPYGGSHVSPR